MCYMFGSNVNQRLGLGLDAKEVRQPSLLQDLVPSICKDANDVSYMNKIVDVVCASTMTMAVTSSGHCFSWG